MIVSPLGATWAFYYCRAIIMPPLRGLRRLSLMFYYNNDTLSGLYRRVTTTFGASPFGTPACPVGRLMVRHAHHDKNIRLRTLRHAQGDKNIQLKKLKSSKSPRDSNNTSSEPLKKRNDVVILSSRLDELQGN